MWAGLRLIQLKNDLRILVTGSGRVSHGIIETLSVCSIVQVTPEEYLRRDFNVPVFCQLSSENYVRHKKNIPFNFSHFKVYPDDYESTFLPYTKVTDILMTGHFWDPQSPKFFKKEDMNDPGFRITVIADISCDINGGIPSTFRPTTISDPFYSYNPSTGEEDPEFSRSSNITVMAIDNLPGELPRDASLDFGKQLLNNVMHDLLTETKSPMISRATILEEGRLTERYSYLQGYLNS
jgi:hypothetical protein